MDLVLASTSSYRRALIERLGVPFRCRDHRCDEAQAKALGRDPRALAETLAVAKAQSLADLEPDATLIGSDQVVTVAGRVLSKPGDREPAIEQLASLAGREHELFTALAVWHGGRVLTHTDVTVLSMRPLARDEIERYVDADSPWDCAGSFKIEARGIVLFERIQSADQTAITGLPLIALTTILRGLGYRIP